MARIVAELGRPETAEETAARKAEFSRTYRASKTVRNLVAALLATLAIVAVVIFGVPRGQPAPQPTIDVASEASALADTLGRPVLVAQVPDDWRVNAATFEDGEISQWVVAYAPPGESGFLNVAQGFDADEAWVTETVAGSRVTATTDIGGVSWDEYRIDDPSRAGNVSYALATVAGSDRIIVYGDTSAETATAVAASLADGIRTLQEDS
ncbi:DUF4245 family protein [Microbacterium sp. NPDC091313]